MTTGPELGEAHDVAPLDAVAAAALDELQFLCRQKMEGLRSGDFVRSDLARIDKRMAAYADALVVRGPAVMEWLSTKLSAAESAADACGVAVALLESREPRAAQAVLAALTMTEQEPLVHGLQAALRRGPIELVLAPLREWLASGSGREAAAAAEALAFHRQLDKQVPRLGQLVNDADPKVRRAAWRAVALAS